MADERSAWAPNLYSRDSNDVRTRHGKGGAEGVKEGWLLTCVLLHPAQRPQSFERAAEGCSCNSCIAAEALALESGAKHGHV